MLPPWHAHPDVWVVVALLEGSYLFALRWLGPTHEGPGERRAGPWRVASFTMGVAVIWFAADWPVHDLAERYLFSVHMVQHTLISLVAPPLMLLGMPAWLLRLCVRPRPINWVVRHLARPVAALILFNTVIAVTHWPAAVEFILLHHWIHFLSHLVLFVSATLMWWPVISPLPEMPTLSYPTRMLYLFLQSLLPTVPASFLTFGSSPLYHFYVTTPRIWGISPLTDQLIAGLIMKLGGGAILWTAIAVVFFQWWGKERSGGWDDLQYRDVERDIRTELSKR